MNESKDQVLAELKEVTKWLRILALPTLRASLFSVLQKPEERRVYQASDGRTSRDVAELAGVSQATVSNYWRRWARVGLVQETGTKGFQRIVDLADVGIEVEVSNA